MNEHLEHFKHRLTSVRLAASRYVDGRVVGGAVLGATLALATSAVAFTDVANVFVPRSSESLATAESAVNEQLRKAEADCANKAPGSVGAAIDSAWKMHTEMASITPDTDQLFNVKDACWDGVSKIFDLSSTIYGGSTNSIFGAAQKMLLDYSKKRACDVVDKATAIVIGPINKGLDKLSKYPELDTVVTILDAGLGADYKSPAGGDYTLYSNSTNQTPVVSSEASAAPIETSKSMSTPAASTANSSSSLLDRMGGIFGN